jgi:nucleoside-diphosphate-sugar epimerase
VAPASFHSLEPTFGLDRPGDVKHSFANIDRARARLGYRPGVAFADGIGMTYRTMLGVPLA